MSSPPAKPPAPDGGYLWIPASHYNHLLSAARPAAPAPAPSPLPPPPAYLAAAGAAYGPWGAPPAAAYPVPAPAGPSALETQIAALVGAMAAERQAATSAASGAGEFGSGPRGRNKRRRHEYERDDLDCWDGDDDRRCPSPSAPPYYPGEHPGAVAADAGRHAHQYRRPAGRWPAGPGPHSNETIAALVGTVASLQQELAHLRAQHSGPFGLAPAAAAVTPRAYFSPGPPAPQYAARPPVSACAAPQLALGAPPAPAPQQAPGLVPQPQTQAVPSPQGARPAEAAADAASDMEAQPSLLNASSVARVNVADAYRAADLFVDQMMGGGVC
ncbi:capsid scaffold protein [Ateline alphaherpesvirus 1]|nr:capsid scaffold protein [Ateline alphaherpesvirus 1]AQS79189.1 capsid scaffold protein [Ateline alphaherpesvirus 1]